MPGTVICALHEDQAMLAERARAIELPFRRRDSLFILRAVGVAEQPDVQVAAPDFVQVEVVRASVRRRRVLEQEGDYILRCPSPARLNQLR